LRPPEFGFTQLLNGSRKLFFANAAIERVIAGGAKAQFAAAFAVLEFEAGGGFH
jgi:hypothetical protein